MEPKLIEGLKIDVTTEQLAALIGEQIAEAESDAAKYVGQLAVLGDNQDMGNSMVGDRRGRLEKAQDRAAMLRVIRDHLSPGATYRLGKDDMYLIGVVNQRY